VRLRHIEIFYAVYRGGSVTAAAHELSVSQPSVSKVLRHAEDQLGYQLFERTKGRLVPTQAAHELFSEVEHVYQLIRSLNRTAKNIGSRRGGHLRLVMLPSMGFSIIPESISRMRKLWPDVSFELDTLHSRDFAGALFERQCDIAIGYGNQPVARLTEIKLGHSELLLASQEGTLPTGLAVVDPEILTGLDFVGLRDGGPSGEVLLDELDRLSIVPREVVVARTYYVALSLVALGVGVSVVDNFTASAMPYDRSNCTASVRLSALPSVPPYSVNDARTRW